MNNTIKAKLNRAGDKAYVNIDDLLKATYGDDFVKEDSGKTFRGYTIYDYRITRPIATEYGVYTGGADSRDIHLLKQDSYIFFLVENGKINVERGAIADFPYVEKALSGIVDEIMEFLGNAVVELA